ncbi:uncharacterized protein LOC112570498 [Pomacea canaliculata]|uniref:uncharacterized protein LOC112570498 n=1 Tax=Pomacea canaliculata TaxID=400727 RepID=UPI000D73D172|nr:uncharacterized protein LOC112570498 [Pomacea canaliculata]
MTSKLSCLYEGDAGKDGEIKLEEGVLKAIPALPEIIFHPSTTVTKSDILDFKEEGFLLHNLLSTSECSHFITEGEKAGFEAIPGVRDDYRSSQRITFDSPALANLLWERIKAWVPVINISGDPHEKHIHGVTFLMQGTWQPLGLNSMFRLCRYLPGGHFAPHFDGHFVRSAQERSLQTFMLYLNGNFEGGSTNFIHEDQHLFKNEDGKYCAEEKNIICSIQPEAGLAIIFNHHRLHEGQQLKDGVKYILRTDIMFHNISQGIKTPSQDKALELLQEAERKEASGDCLEAAELYRKAFKLSPELAASYGN